MREIGVGKCRIKRDVNHTSMSPVSNGQANIMLHSLRSKTIITLKNRLYIYIYIIVTNFRTKTVIF